MTPEVVSLGQVAYLAWSTHAARRGAYFVRWDVLPADSRATWEQVGRRVAEVAAEVVARQVAASLIASLATYGVDPTSAATIFDLAAIDAAKPKGKPR